MYNVQQVQLHLSVQLPRAAVVGHLSAGRAGPDRREERKMTDHKQTQY